MALLEKVERVYPADIRPNPDPDVTLEEFFTPEFMAEYTRFESFSAFCTASPWSIDDQSDIDRIPRNELDRFVDRTTEFDGWVMMRNGAGYREIEERLWAP